MVRLEIENEEYVEKINELLKENEKFAAEYQWLVDGYVNIVLRKHLETQITEELTPKITEKIYREEIEKLSNKYNLLQFPETSLSRIKEDMKNADSTTVKSLIKYLRLDIYELVKNLAKVTSSENSMQMIAYRDGAISRTESCIQFLEEFINPKTYVNRMTGQMEDKKQKTREEDVS